MHLSNFLNNTYTLALLVVLGVATLVLCIYYGIVFLRVALYKNSKIPQPDELSDGDLPSVSVVIVAHNEAEFLKESLPYLLEQDYPNFEIVVVDYTSHDDTQFVLRVCSDNYPNLKVVNFPEDVNMFQGKKYPLSIGIKSATKDVVLLTEPDSVPKDFSWIKEMMCGYMRGASMVMGYSSLSNTSGLLGALEQYDNMTYNASYLGMAIMGHPYTGTGRNLSYRRDFFFDRGGFISHYSIPDGADDLFVNKNANGANTAVVIRPGASVVTKPRPTFAQWRLERMHRNATRRYYGVFDKLLLSIYPLSQVAFWAVLALLFFWRHFPWQILLGVLVLKIVWQTLCTVKLAKRFEIKKIQFFAPFFELYFLLANTILHILTLRKKNMKWR